MKNLEGSNEKALKGYLVRVLESTWTQWTDFNKEQGFKSNSERVRAIIDADLASKTGTPAKFDFEAAYKQISDLSIECNRQLKLIDDPIYCRLRKLGEEFGLKNNLSNLTETIPKFYSYEIPESDDYGSNDIAIWVQFLVITQKKNALVRKVLVESKKLKAAEAKSPETKDVKVEEPKEQKQEDTAEEQEE